MWNVSTFDHFFGHFLHIFIKNLATYSESKSKSDKTYHLWSLRKMSTLSKNELKIKDGIDLFFAYFEIFISYAEYFKYCSS